MRSSLEIIGKPLISVDNGKKLGTVKDLYFNTLLNALSGIYLGSEGLVKRRRRFIDAKHIVTLGIDTVLVSREDSVEDSDTSLAHKEWVQREELIGRAIETSGGTRIGVIGDVFVGSLGQVKAIALSKVQIDSPVAEAGHILCDAVLDVGGDDSPMIVDLSIAERQSIDRDQ